MLWTSLQVYIMDNSYVLPQFWWPVSKMTFSIPSSWRSQPAYSSLTLQLGLSMWPLEYDRSEGTSFPILGYKDTVAAILLSLVWIIYSRKGQLSFCEQFSTEDHVASNRPPRYVEELNEVSCQKAH